MDSVSTLSSSLCPSTPAWNLDRPFLTGQFYQETKVTPGTTEYKGFSTESCSGADKAIGCYHATIQGVKFINRNACSMGRTLNRKHFEDADCLNQHIKNDHSLNCILVVLFSFFIGLVSQKDGNDCLVCVVPAGSSNFKCFSNQSSLPWVSEIDLVSAVLSGYLDPSIITSPSVLVASSCSTDETVVADSDAETESTKSYDVAAACHSIESSEHDSKATTSTHKLESVEYQNEDKCSVQIVPRDKVSTRDTSLSSTKHFKHKGGDISHDDANIHDPEGGYIRRLGVKNDNTVAKEDINDEQENGKLDIIYSQDLIVRDSIMSLPVSSSTNGGVANFKRFRKASAPSQNSFEIFVPFSKHPYQESECKNEDVAESIKEEKKRKQMEAIAEDLFKSEKKRQRGVAGTLHGLFARQ